MVRELSRILQNYRYIPLSCQLLDEIRQSLKSRTCDLALLDVKLPGLSGIKSYERFRGGFSGPLVLTIAGNNYSQKNVQNQIKKGAFDHINFPSDGKNYMPVLQRVKLARKMMQEIRTLKLRESTNGNGNCENYIQKLSLDELVSLKLDQVLKHLNAETENDLYGLVISRVEDVLLKLALQKADGNQSQAAKLLGINRNTLRTKLKSVSNGRNGH